jgi:hypothetical protein
VERVYSDAAPDPLFSGVRGQPGAVGGGGWRLRSGGAAGEGAGSGGCRVAGTAGLVRAERRPAANGGSVRLRLGSDGRPAAAAVSECTMKRRRRRRRRAAGRGVANSAAGHRRAARQCARPLAVASGPSGTGGSTRDSGDPSGEPVAHLPCIRLGRCKLAMAPGRAARPSGRGGEHN